MKIINKFIRFELIILFLFLAVSTAFAKRMPAPDVPSIAYHGVIYSAKYSQGGIIEAQNATTKKLLWSKQIYQVHYIADLETDVQDVFIKNIKIKNGNLLITDEKDRYYSLNLKTRKIRPIELK